MKVNTRTIIQLLTLLSAVPQLCAAAPMRGLDAHGEAASIRLEPLLDDHWAFKARVGRT